MERRYVVESQGASYARRPERRGTPMTNVGYALTAAHEVRRTSAPTSSVRVIRLDDDRVTAVLSFPGAPTRAEARKLAERVERYEGWRYIDPFDAARGACLDVDLWPTPQAWEAASRDASLGVGHVWTNVACPAYRTLNPDACVCQ